MRDEHQHWQEVVPCRQATDDEIRDMFATVSDKPGGDKPQRDFVAKYCKPCPFKVECLKFAHDTDSLHGVFGALTETERHEIRRKARPGAALAAQVEHCPEPGRRRGADRHRWIGEDPCDGCAEWVANQAARERQSELREAQTMLAVSA